MATEEAPNWSATVEELIDHGDTEGARRLLERLVADLQARSDASTSLALAAALSDLASLYRILGLPSLAHSASSSALLIRQTAQLFPTIRSAASPTLANDHIVASCIPDGAELVEQERPSSDGEEDWENLLFKDAAQLEALSITKSTPKSPLEKNTYKRRGRGAFTCGEMGMHIDRITSLPNESKQPDTITEEGQHEGTIVNVQPKVTYGVRHVLVASFSPSVTTRDLEELFEPFGSDGVSVRWVNDTTALAVFRNPETAKDALQSIKNPSFRLRLLADEDTLLDLVKEGDLQPPVPRPATSSQAAHRMIMSALQRQGGQKKASSVINFKSSQQQEFERKRRLWTRQKLRDEAWGTED